MSMPNDSDFFDLGLDGLDESDGFNTSDISSALSSGNDMNAGGMNEFGEDTAGNIQTADEELDKSMLIKKAMIVAACGIFVIALGFMIVKGFTSKKDKVNDDNRVQINTEQNNQVNTPVQNVTTQPSWMEFSGSESITFNSESIPSIFTITSISHYAKIVDSNNNLMVKTVLTGSLSGYVGTYEIEIPYYKGSQLKEGNYFDVTVKVGEYNGKKVIGEISY